MIIILKYCCLGGNKELVQLMIQKGATQWNDGLIGACEGGHLEIVQYLIEKACKEYKFDWNKALEYAEFIFPNKDIIDLLIDNGADYTISMEQDWFYGNQ